MKVFTSLPQELEDEALQDYDMQGDQCVYDSKFLMGLSSEERQTPEYSQYYMSMFWYVFGYAQAKGWTSIQKRMGQ